MMRHLAFPSMVGNTRQPRRRTISSCRRPSGLDSRSLRALCCDHKEDPCLDCFSLAAPLRSTAGSKPNFSESCSFAVCGSPFSPLLAPSSRRPWPPPCSVPERGVLGRRGFALESAAARVCREAGGRVSVNVAVRDLDIGVPNEADARRLEVVVDGLPLFHGAQLGVDTTCLCCAGTGHLTLGVQTKMEQLWQLLAAARKRAILNWLVNTGAPGWLSSPAKLVGVGQRSVAKAKVRSEPKIMRSRAKQAWLLRWGSILACSSARAFAMSLLERRGGMGTDGPTPSTDDVVWEALSAP